MFIDCDGTNYVFGAAYPGGDLDKTKADSAESCQAFCKTVTNCKRWTWEMDTTECYAKSGENGTANACPSKYGNELSFNPCYKYVVLKDSYGLKCEHQ